MMRATGPPRSRAVRRATLGVLLLSLLCVLAAVTHPSAAEAAEPPGALTADSKGVLEIITVPKLPGARFMVDGRTHSADRQGVVRLKVTSLHKHKISVVDKKISQSDRSLEFVRWYHGSRDKSHLDELSGLTVRRNLRIKAAYRATYKLQYSFVDKARNPIDQTRVSRVEFRSDHGLTVSGNGSGKVTVVGIRPMLSGGTVIAKKLSYTVQRVDVDGSNVVQVNAQRFEPSRKTTVVIPLQLHTLHLSTRDFLFGNPVGQAVWLKYPDGHRFKVALDANGKATVERLAKGSYTVQVDAPGLSFERPLVLSQTQYVDLQHVSRLDIAVAAGAVAAFMLTLYLVRVRGRPAILRSAGFGQSRIWAATQRIPRVKMRTQQLSTQEMAGPGVADPPAVDEQKINRAAADTEKVDWEKELAEDDPHSAQSYLTRVGEAQLPDDLRKAALSEVGTLEHISAQNLEASEIRIWLDTILDLPWSTETRDSIDIQGAREVDPAAADTDNLHTEKVERAAADTKMLDGEKVGPALAGDIAWPVSPRADDAEMVDGERVDPADAELESVDPADAELESIDTADAELESIDTADAELESIDTADAELESIDPADAELESIDTADAELESIDTADAELESIDTADAELESIDTADAELESIDTADAELESIDPAAAKADTAAARPHDDDTAGTPAVLAVLSGGPDPRPQLVEQQVHGPGLVQNPPEKRRFRSLALAATVLAALLIGALLLGTSRDRGATAQSVPTVTATVSEPTSAPSVQLEDLPDSARPFQTVRIQGTYHGGAHTMLRVQRWEEGKWLAFPLPTKTDQSGQFTTHVEFGQPGRYQLRVLDPESGVTSKPFVLVIEG
jgi:uncharacterized protein YjbI with pentapeptide repeats